MALFSDDFEDDSIDAGWTQDTGTGGGFVEERGYLKISSSSGGLWSTFDPAWLYQASISGDFDVVVRVIVNYDDFDAQWEGCGLIAAVDTSNNVRVMCQAGGGGVLDYQIRRQETVAGGSNEGASVDPRRNNFFLRLARSGSTFTAYYSINGSSWTALADPGSTLSSSANVDLGIFAIHPGGSQIEARFTEFTKFADFSFPSESLTEDSFDDASLDKAWFVEGQDGGGISETGGVLEIASSVNDIYTSSYQPYGVFQFEDGDFDYTVKLDHQGYITANYEKAGLLVELDRVNYVFVYLGYEGSLKVTGRHTIDNAVYVDDDPWSSGNVIYLRISRSGSDFAIYYSVDGIEWTELSPTNKLTTNAKVKVLLVASHFYTATPYTVKFDDFQIFTIGEDEAEIVKRSSMFLVFPQFTIQ